MLDTLQLLDLGFDGSSIALGSDEPLGEALAVSFRKQVELMAVHSGTARPSARNDVRRRTPRHGRWALGKALLACSRHKGDRRHGMTCGEGHRNRGGGLSWRGISGLLETKAIESCTWARRSRRHGVTCGEGHRVRGGGLSARRKWACETKAKPLVAQRGRPGR